jgi:hypothetical protein
MQEPLSEDRKYINIPGDNVDDREDNTFAKCVSYVTRARESIRNEEGVMTWNAFVTGLKRSNSKEYKASDTDIIKLIKKQGSKTRFRLCWPADVYNATFGESLPFTDEWWQQFITPWGISAITGHHGGESYCDPRAKMVPKGFTEFLFHFTERKHCDSISVHGLRPGGTLAARECVFFSMVDPDVYCKESYKEPTEAFEQCMKVPYWPRDRLDAVVIVCLDRCIDCGLEPVQHDSFAVTTKPGKIVPPHCFKGIYSRRSRQIIWKPPNAQRHENARHGHQASNRLADSAEQQWTNSAVRDQWNDGKWKDWWGWSSWE